MADQRRRTGCGLSGMRSGRQRLLDGVRNLSRAPHQARPQPNLLPSRSTPTISVLLQMMIWIGPGLNIIDQGTQQESDRSDKCRSREWDYRRILGDGDGDTRVIITFSSISCVVMFATILFLVIGLHIVVFLDPGLFSNGHICSCAGYAEQGKNYKCK